MQSDPVRDEIDRSIGDGPYGVPVDELLTRGRRALRRRRLVAGAGATLAAVAVLGTTAVATGGFGTDASPGPGFAERSRVPSLSPAPMPSDAAAVPALRTPSPREAQRAFMLPLAELDDRGRLVLAPQVDVVQRVDDPFADSAPGTSVALDLDYRRVRYWFFLQQGPDRSTESTSYVWSGDYDGSFSAWVAEHAPVDDDPPPSGSQEEWPGIPDVELVRFVGATERLAPESGVTILRQQPDVSVGDAFAGPEDQTAAAKVEAADGERFYVIARRAPGETPQYIAVTEADGGPTLASFLDLARTRYADDGGGLL